MQGDPYVNVHNGDTHLLVGKYSLQQEVFNLIM